eukprot:1928057-Rhodomonas_salina.2
MVNRRLRGSRRRTQTSRGCRARRWLPRCGRCCSEARAAGTRTEEGGRARRDSGGREGAEGAEGEGVKEGGRASENGWRRCGHESAACCMG